MVNAAIYNKAAHLIELSLDDEFTLLVNPYLTDGLKIINKSQLDVFRKFDGKKDISIIAKECKKEIKQINDFIIILNEKKLIEDNDKSEEPIFENFDKSIDFWVHTTDSCNLRCQYCYIHTKDSKNSIESPLIDKFLKKIIETVISKELKLVSLRLAGGEPFIQFKLWKSYILDLKRELQNYNCDLRIAFLTNLTLLSNEIIDFIKSENIGIGISLDGLNEYQNKARPFASGKGSYDVIYNNILKLIENNIHPSIMTVVSNDNLDGLVDFTKFLVSLNLPFRYSLVQADNFDYKKAFTVFRQVYTYLETEIDKGYSFEKNHKLCDLKLKDIFFQTCGAGLNTGTIYSDGNIYFCQQQVGSDKFLDSINSKEDLMDIIEKGKHFNGELSSECQECKFKYICTGGCPLIRVDGKSPSCDFYKEFIPINLKLIGKERLNHIKRILELSDKKDNNKTTKKKKIRN